MAREILFYETGPAEILKIVEVLTSEPGAGEIRIRVKAIGLNRAEGLPTIHPELRVSLP